MEHPIEKYFVVRGEAWFSKSKPDWMREQTMFQEIIDIYIDIPEREEQFHATISWDGIEPGHGESGRHLIEIDYGVSEMALFADDLGYADPYHLHRPKAFKGFLLAREYEDRTPREKEAGVGVESDLAELDILKSFFRRQSDEMQKSVAPLENDNIPSWFARVRTLADMATSRADAYRRASSGVRYALKWVASAIDAAVEEVIQNADNEMESTETILLVGRLKMIGQIARGDVTVPGVNRQDSEIFDPNDIPF